ncbi:MAG: hypothetical protein PHX62_01135 [Bacilli bacterium]|nr:hypothetical protein [Bacilli bacterium]
MKNYYITRNKGKYQFYILSKNNQFKKKRFNDEQVEVSLELLYHEKYSGK